MAGLDYASDDPTDEFADGSDTGGGALANPLAGQSRGALQKYVDAASDTSGIHSALSQVAQALKADRRQNQIQALFAAAGALGAPTRTGSIGETAANLGKSLSETMGTQSAADRQGAATAAKLQLDEAKAELASKRALGVQAMKAMGAGAAKTPAMKMVGRAMLGQLDPKTGIQQGYRYVEDPTSPGNLTIQVIPVETAKSLIAKQNAAAATTAPAYMPTESDIDPKTGQIVAPPAAAVPGADDALPMRPVDTNPLGLVTGTPTQIMAAHGVELKAKGIDLSGLDQNAPVILNMESKEVKPAPPPDALAPYGDATGQTLLSQLSPADLAQVEAIAKGKIAPPTAGTRSPTAQRILTLATAAYPGVDFAKNYKTVQDFASNGKAGQNIVKGGTAIDHALKLYDSINALGNFDLGPISGTVNGFKNFMTSSNNPAVANFRLNADLLGKEIEAAVKGTGAATVQAGKDWRKNIDEAATPDVQRSVLRRGIGLLGERLQNQVEPYNATLGTKRSFLSWLPPSAQAAFTRINPDYELTDDDKAYLATQELSKRKTGTLSLPAKAAALGPSSAAGGKALPASTLSQYAAVPMANKAAARAHLQSLGYDISGLK